MAYYPESTESRLAAESTYHRLLRGTCGTELSLWLDEWEDLPNTAMVWFAPWQFGFFADDPGEPVAETS